MYYWNELHICIKIFTYKNFKKLIDTMLSKFNEHYMKIIQIILDNVPEHFITIS
jgi:hypothetical protein